MDNVTRLIVLSVKGAQSSRWNRRMEIVHDAANRRIARNFTAKQQQENAKKTLRQLSSHNITFSSTCSIPMRTFHGITNEVIFSVSSRKFPDFPGQWEAAANDIKNAESKLTMKIHISTTMCRKKSLDNTRVMMYSDVASIWRWTGVGYALPSKRFL